MFLMLNNNTISRAQLSQTQPTLGEVEKIIDSLLYKMKQYQTSWG